MTRRSGLGKGLDALIPQTPEESDISSSDITLLPVDQIEPNPQQPRTNFDEKLLRDLAVSIHEHGVIQPLVVMKGKKNDHYTLIAGERRLHAAKLAGLESVPVVLREANNQELLEIALIENLQREDLNPLEAAEAYKQLSEGYNLTQDQIALKVGKNRATISNTIRLLELSKESKQALVDRKISEGHGRCLVGLSVKAQNAALETVIAKGLNVRQTEELVKKYKGQKVTKEPRPELLPEILDIENQLRDTLQTRVKLTYGKKGGSITMRFSNDEELNRLIDQITKK